MHIFYEKTGYPKNKSLHTYDLLSSRNKDKYLGTTFIEMHLNFL